MSRRFRLLSCLLFLLTAIAIAGAGPARAGEKPPSARDLLTRVADDMDRIGKGTPAKVDGVKGRFTYQVSLSQATYKRLAAPLSNLLDRDLPATLVGAGTFRETFGQAGDSLRPDRLFLETSCAQWSFMLQKNGDELSCFSPQLNLHMKDVFAAFSEMAGERGSRLEMPEMGFPRTRDISLYLVGLAGQLRANLDVVSGQAKVEPVERDGTRYYRVSFPGVNGEAFKLDLRADSLTPAALEAVSAGRDLTARLEFPRRRSGAASPFDYLPERLTLSGERGGDAVRLEVTDIAYNPFLTADDFRTREVNLPEFLGIIYLKALSGN